MCGRYTLTTPAEALEALFDLTSDDEWEAPRFNIAPQTKVSVVRQAANGRVKQSILWGAINPRDSRPLINARSENVATSLLFARAFGGSRVLVAADGFFEWTSLRGNRRARYFQTPESGPFAFAGLAVTLPSESPGDREDAAVILTTAASSSIREYHSRMPLVIARHDYAQWLDRATSPKAVMDLMAAGAGVEWASIPVGPSVNHVRNDGPDCIARANHPADRQGSLF